MFGETAVLSKQVRPALVVQPASEHRRALDVALQDRPHPARLAYRWPDAGHERLDLGTELVDRASGQVSESGAVVVHRARRILSEINAIAADVSELNADIRGPVTLGMIGTAGRWIVPLLLEAQKDAYPHIALRIIEAD